MNFELNEDQRMLSETLSRFLTDNYPMEKRHEYAKSDKGHSPEMWVKFAELGIIGALFGEEAGGFGGTGDDLTVVFEQLGRALVVEPFLPTLLAGSILEQAGDRNQPVSLEKVMAGEKMIALAHGEAVSRYELSEVSTRAEQSGNDWTITGDKAVVLGGGSADVFVVSARTSGETGSRDGISLFGVEKSDHVVVRDYPTIDGYQAAEVRFDKSGASLIGEEGAGLKYIESACSKAVLAVCAEALGAMEVAKDLTVEYMKTRKQFGVPIGQFQVLQHRMADILIELEQMRSAVINASGHLEDDCRIRDKHVSAAKYLCGNVGRQVAEESIQIHGGMGMTWEYPVGHYAKRIVMIDHLFGDTDHHLEKYIASMRSN